MQTAKPILADMAMVLASILLRCLDLKLYEKVRIDGERSFVFSSKRPPPPCLLRLCRPIQLSCMPINSFNQKRFPKKKAKF
jgi:hypothetical protein